MLPNEIAGYTPEKEPVIGRSRPDEPALYIATNPVTGMRAMIKAWEDPATVSNNEFRKQFEVEYRISDRLSRPGHPNVVHFIAGRINPPEGYAVLMSDFIEGGTLLQKIQEQGNLGIQRSLETALQTLSGLSYIHELRDIAGVPVETAHGDNHPANIAFNFDGTAVLLDFGHSRLIKAAPTMHVDLTGNTQQPRGPGPYQTPQEKKEGKSEPADDLWRVLKVLGESLGRDRDVVTPLRQLDHFQDLSEMEAYQLENIDEIINRAGQSRDAVKRNYGSASDLALELRHIFFRPDIAAFIDEVSMITSREGLRPYEEYIELQAILDRFAEFSRGNELPTEHPDIEALVENKVESDIAICQREAPLLSAGEPTEYTRPDVLDALGGLRHLRRYLAKQSRPVEAKG